MQTTITVVNLIHDPKTDTDTPVCWVFPACSWRERIGSTGSGTAKDPAREVHIRIPAGVCSAGYPALCAVGSTACRGKDTVLDTETGLEACAGALIRSDRNRVCTSRKNAPVLHGVCCFR